MRDSLVGERSSLGKYITTPFKEVHNLSLAVIAHDLFCLLPSNVECAVSVVCLDSGVGEVMCRVIKGRLSAMLSVLSEEGGNVSFRYLCVGFEFGLGVLEAGCA